MTNSADPDQTSYPGLDYSDPFVQRQENYGMQVLLCLEVVRHI